MRNHITYYTGTMRGTKRGTKKLKSLASESRAQLFVFLFLLMNNCCSSFIEMIKQLKLLIRFHLPPMCINAFHMHA